jgi:hypothetical protein
MRKPKPGQKHRQIDQAGGKPGAEQLQPRQSHAAMDKQIDQHGIGRDRGQRDPQSRLRPVDRAHEAADRQEPQRRRNAPEQPRQILLRQMCGRRNLAQHQQDLLAAQRQQHHRQRNQQGCPKADAKRAPHQPRVACAERLRRKRGDGRHQSHAEGEADEIHRVRQRRRGDRGVAEPPDQGKIGGHHRDLPELRQHDRHRELQRLDQFNGEMITGRGHGDRCSLDFIEKRHGAILALPPGQKRGGLRGQENQPPVRSGTRVILAPSALSRSSMRS